MKTIELLKQNINAALHIKTWYVDKLTESLKDFNEDAEFKKMIAEKKISDKDITKIVERSPRSLLDMFDESKIFVSITAEHKAFTATVSCPNSDESKIIGPLDDRSKIDKATTREAIVMLEALLTPDTEESHSDHLYEEPNLSRIKESAEEQKKEDKS